jgi:hypothetical protein
MFVLVLTLFVTSAPSARAEQLGQWQTSSNPYPVPVFLSSCVTYNGYVYCVGGLKNTGATSATYYAQLTSSGTTAWTATTSYPITIRSHSCVAVGSDIYCIGGAEQAGGSFVSLVYFAPLSASGIGSWTQATSIPQAAAGYVCVGYSGDIYCLSANSGFNGIDVAYYGAASGGSISWATGTNPPEAMAGESCTTWSNYIYCQGNEEAAPYNAAYTAQLGAAGFGTWSNQTATTPSIPTQGLGSCWTSSSYLYCSGGGSTNTNAFYASISGLTIGVWDQTNSLPQTAVDASCVSYSGYVYCIAGYTGSTETNAVVYDSIQPPGSTSTVTVTSTVTTTVTQPPSTTTVTTTSTLPGSTTTVTSTVTSTVTNTPTITLTTTTTSTSIATSTQTQTVTATTTPTVTTTQTQTQTVTTGPTTTVTSTQLLTSTQTVTSTQLVPTTVTSTSVSTSTQSIPTTVTTTATLPPSTVTSTQTVTSPVTTTAPPVTTTVTFTGPYSMIVSARDSQGNVVSGITVNLKSAGGTLQQATNSTGYAVFPDLAAGGSYSVSAVVDGTSLGAQLKLSSNALVVLEPNAVSVTTSSSQGGSSSGNPLLSETAIAAYGLAAAAALGVAFYLMRLRKPSVQD